jgi:SagB-type dehydrogenase family enzyme
VRTRALGPEVYHFRAYSSAGALYPVEVYLADERGLAHFDPLKSVLRRLRREDVRGALAPGRAVLVLTGILWRSAWKYGARAYRHLFWDAGTLLANLLALAEAEGLEARVLTGFVDADVNRLVGADGEREAALALLALGRTPAETGMSGGQAPGHVPNGRVSGREQAFPEVSELHAASSLHSRDEVRRYRGSGKGESADLGLSTEELARVLRRRGSERDFALEQIGRDELAAVLGHALGPIPADVPLYATLALVVNAVAGLVPGTYRFRPPDGFELLRAGSFRREAGYLVLEQALGARAAATLFFLADLEAALGAHGNRGYRAVQLEAGIRVGRVYLAAVARRLGATASTFYDDDVIEFLAPGTTLAPTLAAALGRRPKRRYDSIRG